VLVGRGVLRNPWILAQARDIAAGLPPRLVTMADRGQFLLDYIELLRNERVRDGDGEFQIPTPESHLHSQHDRWIVNKLRALGSWYTKGLDGGSHLRTSINSAISLPALCEIIEGFFMANLV
jgi:tRNA-dihydrouridine synthase